VEAEAALREVDAQPLIRRLLIAASEHLREASSAEEVGAVERTVQMPEERLTLGGSKPEELEEALPLLG
jgi:hypothetical protein